jgi:hypothetical protein
MGSLGRETKEEKQIKKTSFEFFEKDKTEKGKIEVNYSKDEKT